MMPSQFYFFREGIHTHLVLPSELLLSVLPELAQQLQGAAWARIGWGDYRYYGAPDQTLLLGLRALLLPTRSVIAVLGIDSIESQASSTRSIYNIPDNHGLLQSVVEFVRRHFAVDRDNQIVQVRNKPCGEVFYRSRGVYMCINTCNNWTSRGLKTGGLRCLPIINFFPGQVEQSVRRNGYQPLL